MEYFLSIYALKGNNHTCDYFSICFGILLGLDYLSFFLYSCGALYKTSRATCLRQALGDFGDFQLRLGFLLGLGFSFGFHLGWDPHSGSDSHLDWDSH